MCQIIGILGKFPARRGEGIYSRDIKRDMMMGQARKREKLYNKNTTVVS